MTILQALLNLLRVGQEVADPVKWKTRQVTVNAVSTVIIALFSLLGAFGWSIPWTLEIVEALALIILAVANILLTVVTSSKVGVFVGDGNETP